MGALLGAMAVLVVLLSVRPVAAQSSVDADLARYWSGSREMPVIAGEKLYSKDGRMELGLFGGILPNDDFFTYYPVGVNVAYHFDSIWGIELKAAYVDLKSDSALTAFLADNGANIRKNVDLGDTQVARVDVVGLFSPLYGKWSFQTYKISHFDFFFMLGVGMLVLNEPEIPKGLKDPAPDPVSRITAEGLVGAGFRFFATDWMSLRLDARWFMYQAFDDSIAAPADITLGVSFLTPEL
ncbi:MAG: outer membrane beta-barrel domain-containing protein [Myxococcota bacterium]|jgi:outer membrane beta-barrel protein|nr:outer membrane beta-barrel domain-containing protein [Myxococcota bacterium]